MAAQKDQNMIARAEVFKALGHPARLAMVVALGDGERCVCDLQEVVGLDMSTVSKHLTVLRHVGLVDTEKRGKQVFYSLRCSCTRGFLKCVDSAILERQHG
jgi:ArsR family transcriptional regulator